MAEPVHNPPPTAEELEELRLAIPALMREPVPNYEPKPLRGVSRVIEVSRGPTRH